MAEYSIVLKSWKEKISTLKAFRDAFSDDMRPNLQECVKKFDAVKDGHNEVVFISPFYGQAEALVRRLNARGAEAEIVRYG